MMSIEHLNKFSTCFGLLTFVTFEYCFGETFICRMRSLNHGRVFFPSKLTGLFFFDRIYLKAKTICLRQDFSQGHHPVTAVLVSSNEFW